MIKPGHCVIQHGGRNKCCHQAQQCGFKPEKHAQRSHNHDIIANANVSHRNRKAAAQNNVQNIHSAQCCAAFYNRNARCTDKRRSDNDRQQLRVFTQINCKIAHEGQRKHNRVTYCSDCAENNEFNVHTFCTDYNISIFYFFFCNFRQIFSIPHSDTDYKNVHITTTPKSFFQPPKPSFRFHRSVF